MAATSQNIPPPTQAITSSAIREAIYLADARELRITFMSGRRYAYADVPQAIYDAFLASPSKGTFFNIAIRGQYHFHEITSLTEPAARIHAANRSAR